MSQEIIRNLLMDLGGKAATTELVQRAREQYPDRTLHRYLTVRLNSMEKKRVVNKIEDESTTWELTEKGQKEKIGEFKTDQLDEDVRQKLSTMGVEIQNIVCSINIEYNLDLFYLSREIDTTEYYPETFSAMIYKPSANLSTTLLVHSTGRISVTGAKSTRGIRLGVDHFLRELESVGMKRPTIRQELVTDNIVATGEFSTELDLDALSKSLDSEKTEYEPEQHPAVRYRTSENPVIMIFRTGKYTITGGKNYLEILDSFFELRDTLKHIGAIE